MKAPQVGTISGYCWDRNPRSAGRCVLNAGHRGDHYDWYARRSWDRPGAEWPNRVKAS
ncbi:hypothetical protein ACIOEW_28090 [Streptomyces sp. NPDC087901]|uniref:hypothetical protein n=1 Tax=Streptomyces sp. NPDC087901 TaxID=3365818 RepID=UPI00381660D4